MARRRSRRRKNSYTDDSGAVEAAQDIAVDGFSPRARRLVESGVIDLGLIAGSGEDGKITSGDILHAARVMEMEQAVPRIERAGQAESAFSQPDTAESHESPLPGELLEAPEPIVEIEMPASGTSTTAQVGGEPISVAPDPWEDYNGSSEGLSESALPGAEQSWGEAEANIAAIAEEAAALTGSDTDSDDLSISATGIGPDDPDTEPLGPDLDPVERLVAESVEPEQEDRAQPEVQRESITDLVAAANEAVVATSPHEIPSDEAPMPDDGVFTEHRDVEEPMVSASQGEVMMDFGTLELVDPESVWAQGAEDFAPWFLAHSQQLGDVLGLDAGLSDARQFTTKSATGVVGRDDNGDDVVVVSSKNATADDSDLGRALGMAASSGAASVALVSAALHEDQLKALSWLNSQTKSGVKWYGIEMRVVRIADSPAAMLFDLVASPLAD